MIRDVERYVTGKTMNTLDSRLYHKVTTSSKKRYNTSSV